MVNNFGKTNVEVQQGHSNYEFRRKTFTTFK